MISESISDIEIPVDGKGVGYWFWNEDSNSYLLSGYGFGKLKWHASIMKHRTSPACNARISSGYQKAGDWTHHESYSCQFPSLTDAFKAVTEKAFELAGVQIDEVEELEVVSEND